MNGSIEIKAKSPRLISIVDLFIWLPIITWLIFSHIPLEWINIGQENHISKSANIAKLFLWFIFLILSFNMWKGKIFSALFGYSFSIEDTFIKIINKSRYVKKIPTSNVDRITHGDERPFWKNFNFDYIPYKIYMKNNSKPLFFDIYTHFNNVEEINKILEARFGKLEYEKFDI